LAQIVLRSGTLRAHRREVETPFILLASVVLAVVAGIAFEAEARPQLPPQPMPGYIKIDGAKTPEAVPEHWLWRNVFHSLPGITRDMLRTQLVLTREEEDLLYAQTRLQIERDSACEKRQRAQLKTIEHASPKEQTRALKSIRVECRQADLDAADALLERYTPETRERVAAWVNSKRTTLTIVIPKADLDIFNLPR
jgi:hypothetical protein